jgi:hypothetical protein
MKLVLLSLLVLVGCETTKQERLKEQCELRGARYIENSDPVFIGTCILRITCTVGSEYEVKVTFTEHLTGKNDDFRALDNFINNFGPSDCK